jgi:hypothetical protein
MMMKKDYDRWYKEKLYLFNGWPSEWNNGDAPQLKALYTKNEATEFMKKNKYYHDVDVIDDELFKEAGFIYSDDEGNYYLESFYQEFTTPSGETIVAFGEYGYDG